MWHAYIRLLWLIAVPVTNDTVAWTFRKSTEDLPNFIWIAFKNHVHIMKYVIVIFEQVSLYRKWLIFQKSLRLCLIWYHYTDQVSFKQQDSRHWGWSFWWPPIFTYFVSKISFFATLCVFRLHFITWFLWPLDHARDLYIDLINTFKNKSSS